MERRLFLGLALILASFLLLVTFNLIVTNNTQQVSAEWVKYIIVLLMGSGILTTLSCLEDRESK